MTETPCDYGVHILCIDNCNCDCHEPEDNNQ